ncbi:MAG: acyltransferase [Thaumarchaeota archaeon]|nr:acyltransferase [Nitrososphaerota archaeon]
METNLSFVQFRPAFGDKDLNLENAVKLLKQAKQGIIVLPELFSTGYTFTSKKEAAELAEEAPKGKTCRRVVELSGKMRSTLIAGFAEKSSSKVFNSALVASRGEFLGVYRKAHLFYKEKLWFSQGDTGFRIFDTKDGKVGVIICFDWIYPEATRILAVAGAEVIAHPANLVLPGLAQKGMCVRSLENRIFTITANRVGRETRGEDSFRFTGRSQIVSPKMKVLVKASSTETVVKSVAVDLSEARKKAITRLNDLMAERRVDLYGVLTQLSG